MAIIYSYPRATNVESSDLLLICDSSSDNKATQTTTIQSINDLGPQGTVTDVSITAPTGFNAVKSRTDGNINFDISLTSGLGLPADDPLNSVQFNLNNVLTGVPGFTFEEASYSAGDELNLNIGTSGKRGLLNVIGGGASQPAGVIFSNDQPNRGSVGIFGPVGVGGDGYNFRVPLRSPENPSTLTSPVLLAVEGTQTGNLFTTSWIPASDITTTPGGQNNDVQYNDGTTIDGDSSFKFYPINSGTEGEDPNSIPKAHEILLGAGGGALPGMLTLFGDDDPKNTQGTSGILRYVLSTGIDYVTITGPDIQTELTITTPGANYVVTPGTETTGTPVTGGQGSGLRIFIVSVSATGAIEKVSIAQQGGGYDVGDIVSLPNLGDGNAEFRVAAPREGGDEILQYDIKLPKYKPFDDKIWFGKGTGKYGELTTSNFFKVKEEAGKEQSGLPTTGTTLQLQIGNPTSVPVPPGSQAEPYGSILLHGGNNTSEGGSIRFISGGYGTQWVNLIGPPGSSSTNVQPAPNPYSVMLPRWSPDVSETMFPDLPGGVSGIESPPQGGFGQNYSTASRLLTETNSANGSGCRVNIVSVNQNGGISNITVDTPGHGYQAVSYTHLTLPTTEYV